MVAIYFIIMIAVPVGLGLYVGLRGVPRSRRCPYCAQDTLRIRSAWHRLPNVLLRSTEFHCRWCPACGWQGAVRVPRPTWPTRSTRPTRGSQSAEPVTAGPGADRVDIRQLDIDGQHWKVMVQCWAEGERWVGNLLFVGPDGHARRDDHPSLEGASALEVLSCALSIPEQALAGRIRRAIH